MKGIISDSKNHNPTREEEYIKFYLQDNRIHSIEQLVLNNLKGDTKKSRRVDFYLDKLDIYVEYYGLYNSTKAIRNEYDNKTNLYFKNGLATIILYPHELGILDYAFHTKMIKLFKIEKFKNRKKKLYMYILNRYFRKGRWRSFFISLFWTYLFVVFSKEMVILDESLNALLIIISLILSISYFVDFITDIVYFLSNKAILE